MINFFKNIFIPANNKRSILLSNEDKTKIFFDRNKSTFIEIKIIKEHSCQDIHSQYHNEILSELMKYNSFSSGSSYNRILNSNEFGFIIIDDENQYCEIKLKMKDCPLLFMSKSSINLYYINISQNKNDDEIIQDKVEDTSTLNAINSSTSSKYIQYAQNIQITHEEDCIREGELLKYSLKHKRFDKRLLVLDKEKLIITKPRNKGMLLFINITMHLDSTILPLSDISSITREISLKSIKDKYTFEIITYEGDKYIFKSKHNADMETWIEIICLSVGLIRDNKFITKYGDQITTLIKDSYEKIMKIIYNCLSIKGIISIKELRHLLYKLYDSKLQCDLLEEIINYKISIRYYKYLDAWTHFLNVFALLHLDSFDLAMYYNPSLTGMSHNLSEDDDGSIKKKIKKNVNDSYGVKAGEPNSPYQNKSRKNSGYENVVDRKILYENTNKKEIEKISNNSIPEFFDFNSTNKSNLANGEQELDMNSFYLNTIKSQFTQSINSLNMSSQNKSFSDSNLEEEFEKKKTLNLIKHLISFENLKFLKTLKVEVKEIIETIKSPEDINNNNELNLKLNNFLKSNIFSEIFDNLLSKYFQNFYKCINTNPEFTSRIENILLYYFKIKNNMTTSNLIDLDHLFHLQTDNNATYFNDKSSNNLYKSSKDDNEINFHKSKDFEGAVSALPASKTLK